MVTQTDGQIDGNKYKNIMIPPGGGGMGTGVLMWRRVNLCTYWLNDINLTNNGYVIVGKPSTTELFSQYVYF